MTPQPPDHIRLLEALLFASAEPLTAQDLTARLPDGFDLGAALAQLQSDYAGRGIALVEYGGRWAFRTAQDLADALVLEREARKKPSRAAMETLAIIAYHQPVTRAEIENIRGVTTHKGTLDTLIEEGWVRPVTPLTERAESIGIIGAGPGGLAAADRLRRMGFQVTVYDRHDRAGGLMIYGIPGFKLEKHVVERRNALLAEGGVEFVLNANVGEDISFDAIRGKHDAVLIATGVYKTRDLDIDNAEARGVVRALDYLT